jgi:hypothetical protein
MLRTVRNIAIIMVLALIVAEVPGGGNLADGLIAAITIGFLVAIGATGYMLYRQNRFTYMGLSEGRRAIVVGGLGAIVLMVAGADEMLETGAGVFVWLAVLGVAIYGIVRVYQESRAY